jgi:hypothetical protein
MKICAAFQSLVVCAAFQSLVAQDESEAPFPLEQADGRLLLKQLLAQPRTPRCLKVNGWQPRAGSAAGTNCWGRV